MGQGHGLQKTGHEYQMHEDGQEDRAYGDGAYDAVAHKDKAIGKRTKPKRLCRRVKHGRESKMVVRMRMTYESIEDRSAEQ